MNVDFGLITTSVGIGAAYAMDAFSVSLANGLNDHGMRAGKACGIAGLFALFQALMPLLGWICIHTVVQYFHSFEKFIPWIALILLAYIGGKMLWDGIKNKDCGEAEVPKLGFGALIVQGIATSIDALSVGFTIADYDLPAALIAAVVIALVTFIICLCGVLIGKKMGTCLAGKASIFGGVILIGIGIWIFVKGFFGF
jgi:putative Mn2+ efflux pump MntP